MTFAGVALGLGGSLLAVSTQVDPDAPLVIAAVLLGLALPALTLTHREAGRSGVRALLRDCIRMPRHWWWLPLAGFGLPVLTWTTGAALGGARPLTWGLVAFYAADLVIGALIINIWEEMAWTGYFQRRAATRWGMVSGALVTSVFFTGIHVPLAVADATSTSQVATNLLYLAGVAIAVRLLIARVDPWSGGSLLTVGILHSAFNATESVLEPRYFWVRIVVTIAAGTGAVALGRRSPSAR
jgi:membrane protease YdiL (CAAX protease family)